MQPDPSTLLERLSISEPLIGFYDAPDPAPFEPLTIPRSGQCVFASLQAWRRGKTLHLTRDKHGCGAAYLLGMDPPQRDELVEFLCDEEGIKATHELMNVWLDAAKSYQPVHEHLLIGPLRPAQYEYLRSVTFYANADQLALLCAGAVYYSRPGDVEPVVARFGSGCMQLTTLFDDLGAPQALIAAADHTMRKYLAPRTLGLVATKSMFERLCDWAADPKSSLHSEAVDSLIRTRGGSLAI
jgi:hypothetical protein